MSSRSNEEPADPPIMPRHRRAAVGDAYVLAVKASARAAVLAEILQLSARAIEGADPVVLASAVGTLDPGAVDLGVLRQLANSAQGTAIVTAKVWELLELAQA